jgi:rhomboid protease GluP
MNSTGSNGQAPFLTAEVQPEILPPATSDGGTQGYIDPRDPARMASRPRSSRQRWASAPATYVLVGINCAVFLFMLFNGAGGSPTAEQLLHFGANNGGLVLQQGEWWRLLTATFVHIGILHLATNMWCLWNLGLLGEPLLGPFGMFAAYVLTGIAGNMLSVIVHPGLPGYEGGIVGAGASGAVFGLAGVLIVMLKSPLLPVPREELHRLRKSVIYFAVLNFVIGGSSMFFRSFIQIDNMAHLGGFLSGLAFGVPLVPKIGASPSLFVRRRLIACCGLAFLLVLAANYARQFRR